MALGFAILIITAAMAGAPPLKRGSGECCCCCLCKGQGDTQVRILRAVFVLVYLIIYGITISALVFEQIVSTTNGRDPNPWIYFSFQWAGGFVLLLVSAWFVDMFIMFGRALRFIRRRFLHGARSEGEKFMLPLWAFPLMWFVTFSTLVSVASVQGAKDPVVRTVEVPLTNLPTCLDGYSLAMISDIHAGPTVGRPEMSRHVEAINALGADAIVMVGDLVDDQVEDIGVIVEPISGFSAPDGQFFVPGNHEEYTGEAAEWSEFVGERGFTVLTDNRTTLPPGGEAAGDGCFFYLAGANDYESSPDYDAALDGREDGIATVLLAHQPTQVTEASKYTVGLQLSGHTHGGQVFPYHVLAYLDQGYVSGLHKKDGTFIYVSEGAVGWGPRMRLLSTTEYTLIVLRSPELFSDADTSTTESTRATGAAGVLLLLSFIYCLGYPIVRAFRRAKEARDVGGGGVGGDGMEWGEDEGALRRRVVAGDHAT
eukprot:jgi/Undpi1/12556/HiC_scaffold_6.g02225.m1